MYQRGTGSSNHSLCKVDKSLMGNSSMANIQNHRLILIQLGTLSEMEEGSMMGGSMMGGSMMEESMMEGSMMEESMMEGSMMEESMMEECMMEGSMMEGSMMGGSMEDLESRHCNN